MAYFDRGGLRIYYEASGEGDPVLVLPGWGGSIDELTTLRAALAPGRRVIAADVPGSGRSLPQPRTYPESYYRDDARVLLELLDALSDAPTHLVGFSDGGEDALLMAALAPTRVRSVVTWGAAGSLPNAPELTEVFGALVDAPIPPLAGFSTYLKAAYGEVNARVMVQSTAAAQRAIMASGGDISRSLAAGITCPALLITGEHDFLATPALVADMAAAIPDGVFVEARGAGHPVHLEQPAWLMETVTGWLASH